MSDEQFQQTADVWRKMIARRLPDNDQTGPQRTVAELRTELLSLAERARPWILPPQRGFSGETTALLRQWQPAWTQDLKASPMWRAAKSRIAAIRESILNGKLDDADWEIRDIFIRCVPAARQLALAGFPVRAVSRDRHGMSNHSTAGPEPNAIDSADQLNTLLNWLESQ